MKTVPISIQSEVRNKTRALMRANEVIESSLLGIDNFQSSVLGDVGSAGSTILGFAFDTPSIDIESWSQGVIYSSRGTLIQLGPGTPFRVDVENKIPDGTKDMIKGAYSSLNAYAVRVIPNEVPEGDARAILRDIRTGATITAHDFRHAGDTGSSLAIGRAQNKYIRDLGDILGNLINFSPFIVPTKEEINITNSYNDVEVEGVTMTVDSKGSKVVPTGDVVDNTALR